MCKEPCETPKTYASSTTLPGPTSSRKRLDRYARTAHENEERPPVSARYYGPLYETQAGYLVETNRRYTVAIAFVEASIFKYGQPKTLISDNGKQFAAKFFQAVYSLLGLSNIFTSTYHPQTNGEVERYNRTILAILWNYVNAHQDDWDRYATALTYA